MQYPDLIGGAFGDKWGTDPSVGDPEDQTVPRTPPDEVPELTKSVEEPDLSFA